MPPKGNKKVEKSTSKAVSKADNGDKPKTKRTASPYILFCTAKRPEVKSQNPNASFGDIGKLLGSMWANLDEKSKAVYVKEAAAKKAAANA